MTCTATHTVLYNVHGVLRKFYFVLSFDFARFSVQKYGGAFAYGTTKGVRLGALGFEGFCYGITNEMLTT